MAAGGEKEEEECLVEQREVWMVALSGSRKPIKREGWFLKPSRSFTHEAPFAPPQHKPISLQEIPIVSFKGWTHPKEEWQHWVDKLRSIYWNLWKKSGIFDAVEASTCKIRKDPVTICGVLEFWCEETQTFVLPWAEATVTLEDVMILGGLSAVGECVREVEPSMGEFAEMELKMAGEHRKFYSRPSKKPDFFSWMKHFMDGEGDQFEHIAFLSLWLSKYIFPGPPEHTVKKYVFPIAIRLARGARIALAPAVLASLYRDFRLVKEHLIGNGSHESPPLAVWAPFSILQLWVWEHFMALRPEKPLNFMQYDEPRAARWRNVGKKTELSIVRFVLESPQEFQWRPYTISLDNWRKPSFYNDKGGWLGINAAGDAELESFARCLRACELVGLDCIEQYLPYRVAMQFGLDQDLPVYFPRVNSTWELAWATYDKPVENVVFYIPPRLFESDVTLQYNYWWKQSMLDCSNAVKTVMGQRSFSKNVNNLKDRMEEKKQQKIRCPPNKKKRKLQDAFSTTLSEWINGRNKPVESHEHLPNVAESQRKPIKFKMRMKCTEEIKQGLDANEQTKEIETREVAGASTCDPLEMESKENMKDGKRKNDRDFAYNPIVIEEPDGVHPPEKVNYRREESTRLRGEQSDQEMQIRMLKEEIAALEATVVDLESLPEVNHKPKLFPYLL